MTELDAQLKEIIQGSIDTELSRQRLHGVANIRDGGPEMAMLGTVSEIKALIARCEAELLAKFCNELLIQSSQGNDLDSSHSLMVAHIQHTLDELERRHDAK